MTKPRILELITEIIILIGVCFTLNTCNPGYAGLFVKVNDGQTIYTAPVIAFTDRVSPERRAAILDGIGYWDQALRGGVLLVQVPGTEVINFVGRRMGGWCQPTIIFDVIDSKNDLVVELDKKKEPGYKNVGSSIVSQCGLTQTFFVDDRLTDIVKFTDVAAHEFGHGMGLDHVDDARGIMFKHHGKNRGRSCLTKADAIELCENLRCKTDTVRYCD